jgi:hypothetical protein
MKLGDNLLIAKGDYVVDSITTEYS